MEELNYEEYLRIIPQIGDFLKSKNIAGIFKYKCVLFAAAGKGGKIYLSSNSLKHMKTIWGLENSIFCLGALSNKILASGSRDSTIKIWDIEKRRLYINIIWTYKGDYCHMLCKRRGVCERVL